MYADKRSDQPIELDKLRLDGGTQPREAYDEQVLSEYADRMELDDRGFIVDPQGQSWEPIVLYDDDEHLWLADGFHKHHNPSMKPYTPSLSPKCATRPTQTP